MTLFGSLSSGVSGLTAQSSAMGAISDNITNVSTIGYKNTIVNFATLVTKQTSTTFYSAGGVQSKPRTDTGVQGLLQASTSQTDIALSGSGYFVVNEANVPTINNEFLYTRAGSFFQDNEGYLRNSSGFYLQGWPVNALGTVVPNNKSLTIPNQNVISTDYLATVNLNRVGGTAAATTKISIGANLPSNDTLGKTHKTDVQFFDTLGNANTMSVIYTKTNRDNQWDTTIRPPQGTAIVTQEDSSGNTFKSIGHLEFIGKPAEGAAVTIEGQTYEFSADATITAGNVRVTITTATTVAQDVASLIARVIANDSDFDTTNNRIMVDPGNTATVLIEDDGTRDIIIDPSGLITSSGTPATRQEAVFTVRQTSTNYRDYQQFVFPADPAAGNTITINGNTYTFQTAAAVTAGSTSTITIGGAIATTLASLETAIEARDAQFASGATTVRVRENSAFGQNNTLVLENLSSSYSVSWAGVTINDTAGAAQTSPITINKTNSIVFNSDGIPSAFAVAELDIAQFQNGAYDMDDDASRSPQITMDFGTVGEANGMTQFGAEFTPVFITTDGSQFGTFAGVTIDAKGLITALFDNGETRPVYKLPIATFVNVNALDNRTGNVWNATQASGDPTLREADNGPAGQVVQASLEQSTVDIGEEFTKMIVVQRAFSAAAKIISTADEMLEELLRTKR
ncbi:MAG: flagellar hook-basal body complex protein [Rhodospirillaceae bacterium]